MWTFQTSTGKLIDPQGRVVGIGYSGHGEGLNNTLMNDVHSVGPIPTGFWGISEFFNSQAGKGPIVAHLDPIRDTDAHDRTGFMIHGDNSQGNCSASDGCIVLSRYFRKLIDDSGDRVLEVIG